MVDMKGFTIRSVRWEWLKSHAMTSDPNPRPPIEGKPLQIQATCNVCKNEFDAREAAVLQPGVFTFPIGGASMMCPQCGQQAAIDLTGK